MEKSEVKASHKLSKWPGKPHVGRPVCSRRPPLGGELGLYLPLDHVRERRSPKLREFEVRQVGSGRKGVLIIGPMRLSCRSECGAALLVTSNGGGARTPRAWDRARLLKAAFLAAQRTVRDAGAHIGQ